MKIFIATKNKGKVSAAKKAFDNFFEDIKIYDYDISSDVPNQPVNLDIYKGAKNRVNNLIKYSKINNISADYYIAIESGITNLLGKWCIVNVAVIKDSNNIESFGISQGFPVPNKYVDEIINTEFGTVIEKIFKERDLRSTVGGVSYLTKNKITRLKLTEDAFTMALTTFVNGDIWKD